MSGYSPTWTSKGSDKLRSLQVTKILMNSIERVISSIDITDERVKIALENAIANTIHTYFTPHKDIPIEKQFETLLEFLGWKIISIVKDESGEFTTLKLGANRFIDHEADNPAYYIIINGIAKAIGYFIYANDVTTEMVMNQFDMSQSQVIIRKGEEPIPAISLEAIKAESAAITQETEKSQTKRKTKKESQPTAQVIEIKPTIEIKLEYLFSPILQNYPYQTIYPIFYKVLSEIITSFFAELEDSQVKKAKESYSEKNTIYLIEYILTSVSTAEQQIKEVADLVGQYLVKAIKAKNDQDLKDYLLDEIVSDISRRVSYVEFPARAYCNYAPGEKCVAGKRDLCDFVLFMWQGMLKEIIPEKKFKLGERISATRRGKFCLAEFLKGE